MVSETKESTPLIRSVSLVLPTPIHTLECLRQQKKKVSIASKTTSNLPTINPVILHYRVWPNKQSAVHNLNTVPSNTPVNHSNPHIWSIITSDRPGLPSISTPAITQDDQPNSITNKQTCEHLCHTTWFPSYYRRIDPRIGSCLLLCWVQGWDTYLIWYSWEVLSHDKVNHNWTVTTELVTFTNQYQHGSTWYPTNY